MARPPATPLLAAAAAVTLLLLAAAPAAHAAECLSTIVASSTACARELLAARYGKPRASVSVRCCQAAAAVYTPAFASDCACDPAVASYRDFINVARKEIADKCGASASALAPLPACPNSGLLSARAAAGADVSSSSAAIAAPEVYGNGSVCDSQGTSCAVKCTPRKAGGNPTADQIAAAKTCASQARGFCNGLGVDGAATGVSVCGEGAAVPDPKPRNGVSRQCFKCCKVLLQPNPVATLGRDACQVPRS